MQKNVIKVSIVHYKGGLDNMPKFELYEDQGYTPEVKEYGEYWELISGASVGVPCLDGLTVFNERGEFLAEAVNIFTNGKVQSFLTKAQKTDTLSRTLTEAFFNAICGSPAWLLWTSQIPPPANGTYPFQPCRR